MSDNTQKVKSMDKLQETRRTIIPNRKKNENLQKKKAYEARLEELLYSEKTFAKVNLLNKPPLGLISSFAPRHEGCFLVSVLSQKSFR